MKTEGSIRSDEATAGPVVIQGSAVQINSVIFEAPKAAAVLGPLEPAGRVSTAEILLEMGADHYLMARSSATVKLMETQVESLVTGLDRDLREKMLQLLSQDREQARREMSDSIERFSANLGKTLARYVDAEAPESLPTVLTRRLEEVSRSTMNLIGNMLQEGDGSVLVRQGDRIIKAVREDLEMLKRQVIETHARASLGTAKGRTFEEELTRVLANLARALGAEVTRCGDHPGIKGRKHGDHLISLCGPFTRDRSVKVVIEAKDHEAANGRFSTEAVRTACRQAIENRGADVAIFITDTPELLPEGRSFGTVDGNFYLTYDPLIGDDTALAATVHMAISQTLLSAAAGEESGVDSEAARRELAQLRKLLDEFDAIESAHSGAIRYIQKASSSSSTVRAAILNSVGRLDSIVSA